MKRLSAWLVPLVVVAAVNLVGVLADGPARAFRDWVVPCHTWGYVVLAVTALGVILLGWGRARASVLLVPALPALSASIGSWVTLSQTHVTTLQEPFPMMNVWGDRLSWHGDEFFDAMRVLGTLRVLGSVESFALALALVSTHAPAWWRSVRHPGDRAWPLALGYFALTSAILGAPYLEFLAAVDFQNVATLPPLVAAVATALCLLGLRGVRREALSDERSTPYREPANPGGESHEARPVDPSVQVVFASLLLPWITRSYQRGLDMVSIRGWPQYAFFPESPSEPVRPYHAILELITRHERWVLPLSVLVVGLALWRGADRRAVRAWAVAATLLATDRVVITKLIAMRTDLAVRAPRATRVWASVAIDDVADAPSLTRHERWSADGAVTLLAPPARDETLSFGEVVYLDPHLSGRALTEHLRQWRALDERPHHLRRSLPSRAQPLDVRRAPGGRGDGRPRDAAL